MMTRWRDAVLPPPALACFVVLAVRLCRASHPIDLECRHTDDVLDVSSSLCSADFACLGCVERGPPGRVQS